jgi:tetratricopeptide (TPR) repeat protein
VLAFAFLAASFAVRNSDFWMHLASGRLLAGGNYHFGVDPFAYTTQGVYWANHAWLFDLLVYLLFTKLGEIVLVIVKALLVAGLAALLLSIRRPGTRFGVPALCTLLAVLAMSPRLLLHSTLLSYLLLGLTLWLLWRPGKRATTFGQQLRHYAPLLLVFVLWVNLDAWFLLGPLLAALFWLGDWIAPARGEGETTRRTPAWLWLLGLALLVLNPHHVNTSLLPAELMPLPDALRHDVRFHPLNASPWHMGLYYHPFGGVNWAGGAYLVLLIVGALSFVMNGRRLAGWRLLVWLTFAGLSAWLGRTIPFFAVVAGPITALNVQDYLSRRSSAAASEGVGTRLGRAAVFVAGLGLIFLAWPGWLQGFQDSGRHVAWTVQEDSSLRRVAQTLSEWHQQGRLGEGRGFHSHPSVVHYCAWFCPEEKGFLDRRLELFHGIAEQYAEICAVFNPGLDASKSKPKEHGHQLLADWGITHLVLYDPALPRLFPALKQLTGEEPDWTLLHIDGQALVLGWRDNDRLSPREIRPFDAERLAFTSSALREDEQMVLEAPGRGPLREPRSGDFWSQFGSPLAPSPWETDASGVLLRYFTDRIPAEQQKHEMHSLAWQVMLSGAPALSCGSLEGALRLAAVAGHMPSTATDPGQQPPALPLLAVRLARRAVAQNPDDANAYLFLADAYSTLRDLTPERTVLGAMTPLAQMRHIQIAAALENVVRLQPNHAAAHEHLANVYERRRFFDAALDHRREALRLFRRAGPISGEKPKNFDRRLQEMEDSVRALELSVGELKNEFTLHTQQMGSEPYRKAQIAVRMGLGRLALEDVLLKSPMVLLGGDGVRLQMELLLQMGRIEPVREQLQDPDWQTNKSNLGNAELPVRTSTGQAAVFPMPAYDWLLLCQSAAFGDYDQADAALRAILIGLGDRRVSQDLPRLRSDAASLLAMEIAMSASQPSWIPRHVVRYYLTLLAKPNHDLSSYVAMQADVHVLSGMLSLERGRPDDAEPSFREAVALSKIVSDSVRPSTARPLAETYLRFLHAAKR